MLLDPHDISLDGFSDEWVAANTEEALAYNVHFSVTTIPNESSKCAQPLCHVRAGAYPLSNCNGRGTHPRPAWYLDICSLCIKFFRQVFGNQPANWCPWLIVLSATFPLSYLCILSSLLTVNFTIGDCVLRGSPIDFRQCKIEMKLELCSNKGQFVLKGLSMVTEFLQLNHDSSVIIFCNSRKQLQHFSFHLDKKLDQTKLTIDVININGSLNKIDKFWWIRLFCADRHSHQGQFRALVTTNASNVGIDKHPISLQVWFE